MALWDTYYTVTTPDAISELLAKHGEQARLIAGGTDILVELQRGTRQTPVLIDVTRVPGLDTIRNGEDGLIHLGPMVTHAQAAASPVLQDYALPLAQACWGVGAPALRNRGTIAGNLATASPANDTITALIALDARIALRSVRGERFLSLRDFYTGVRRTVMAADEWISEIVFKPLKETQRGIYLKFGLRRSLAIAVVNIAIVLDFAGDIIRESRIALGSVAPTIIRAPEAEAELNGRPLTRESIEAAARWAAHAARPIDDVRGAAWFRTEEVFALTQQALEAIRDGRERLDLPPVDRIVRLSAPRISRPTLSGPTLVHHTGGPEAITFTLNGKPVSVSGANGKTLLQMLRDDVGLTGTKEGCGEGECGACTVWLDGMAVLACLTPAPRAHGATVVTIEGLTPEDGLHPVQEAFIAEDAVQCGFCTPGFVMSAAKLLEEVPHPTREQIVAALSGNLCRCTGYYKIIQAVERAAQREA